MVTGDLKSKVDKVWSAFWSGGIANPMEVIEQITYMLFIRRLDKLTTKPWTDPLGCDSDSVGDVGEFQLARQIEQGRLVQSHSGMTFVCEF